MEAVWREFELALQGHALTFKRGVRAEWERMQSRMQDMQEIEEKRMQGALEIEENLVWQASDRIELNVGGHPYTTSVATLRKRPGTMLDAMFRCACPLCCVSCLLSVCVVPPPAYLPLPPPGSGRYPLTRAPDGRVFIDRDGKAFAHVLNFLRSSPAEGEVYLAGVGSVMLRRLKREFSFFNIELLVEQDVLYLVGGYDGDTRVATLEQYDYDHWRARRLPFAHFYGLCSLGVGAVVALYAWGGPVPISSKYDVQTGGWSPVAPMSEHRYAWAVCTLDGMLYAVGGSRPSTGTSAERYDPALDTWSAIAPLPEPRSSPGLCALGRCLFVAGGISHNTTIATCLKYDTSTDQWIPIAPLPTARSCLSLCAVGGLIYAVGGLPSGRATARVDCYDPSSDTWSTVAPLTQARQKAGCCVWQGRLHMFGGRAADLSVLTTVERFDASANEWSVVPALELTGPRCEFGLCSAREQMSIFDHLLLGRV